MAYVKRAWVLSSKDGSAVRLSPRLKSQMLPTSRLGYAPSLQHAIAVQYGAVLTELHFSVRAGVWTARVKADFDNYAMVAWIDVGSFGRCLEVLCEYAHMGWIPWKLDDHPPER